MRFCRSPIDRAAVQALRKDASAVQRIREGPSARFLIVHKKQVLTTEGEKDVRLVWQKLEDVHAVTHQGALESIYLGPARMKIATSVGAGMEIFVADVSSGRVEELPAPEGQVWRPGRELMLSDASDEEVTIAGLALAMAGWHETARFDGRDGQPTKLVEGGMKRQADGSKSKLYPRTDPVAIGLIVSSDGKRCLLGRGRQHAPNRFTCIAGFVDQCETVEEAFRREAVEEVGIELTNVELVASQPWPIGRAGSCELMIGCRAVATTDEIRLDQSELQDARWFTRSDVEHMLRHTHPDGYTVPGSFAIAHHLISCWAEEETSVRTSWLPGPAFTGLAGVILGMVLMNLRSRL
eukprot:TRINITY_DN58214_c0_g1_i1.p1 TRINITY_DN58214_c0_g1~~TRINITY_DN58214_c0_g1_i1.p1  ORF type:complete len:352 (+),score=49.36 TRINITY_DN58214_c0_g1_i1:40-1095(+)